MNSLVSCSIDLFQHGVAMGGQLATSKGSHDPLVTPAQNATNVQLQAVV